MYKVAHLIEFMMQGLKSFSEKFQLDDTNLTVVSEYGNDRTLLSIIIEKITIITEEFKHL